ncbi:hypothetical protein IG631_04286 [Alternaria alternata]|nr:hypothetical protein IG631_04286 [Alternaria alternata]
MVFVSVLLPLCASTIEHQDGSVVSARKGRISFVKNARDTNVVTANLVIVSRVHLGVGKEGQVDPRLDGVSKRLVRFAILHETKLVAFVRAMLLMRCARTPRSRVSSASMMSPVASCFPL